MDNMEIEIKLQLSEEQFNLIKARLETDDINYRFQKQEDIYFAKYGKLNNTEGLRIRLENSKAFLHFKKIFFGATELDTHIQEFKTEISDPEQLKLILQMFDINEVLTINKSRYIYKYKDFFEISLDSVEDLGYFIEIEILKNENIRKTNIAINKIIDELKLDIAQRNFDGYSNLMYKKIKDRKII
jgi:predicted adenylyl cyclase CyaB